MTVKTTIISLSTCLLISKLAIAEPQFVYRIDARPPEVIFTKGFKSWAFNAKEEGRQQNLNLAAHLLGNSIRAKTSAFVATAATTNGALQHISYLSSTHQTRRGNVFYAYTIRADDSFYDVRKSIANLADGNIILDYMANGFFDIYDNEFSAFNEIKPENIKEVVRYTCDPEEGSEEDEAALPKCVMDQTFFHSNSRYLEKETQANSEPWPKVVFDSDELYAIKHATQTRSKRSADTAARMPHFMPISFCPSGVREAAENSSACDQPEVKKIQYGPYAASCSFLSAFVWSHFDCTLENPSSATGSLVIGRFRGNTAGLAFWGLGMLHSKKNYFNQAVSALVEQQKQDIHTEVISYMSGAEIDLGYGKINVGGITTNPGITGGTDGYFSAP